MGAAVGRNSDAQPCLKSKAMNATGYLPLPGFEEILVESPLPVAANVELAEQAPAAKPGKAAAVPRRPITDDEREAVRCLGEQVGYAPATWDKKFARDMYGRRDSGLISEKEAAQVWRLFKRYRRQIRHAQKERLLEVAAVHAAPETRTRH